MRRLVNNRNLQVLGNAQKRKAYDVLHDGGGPSVSGATDARPRWRPSGGDDHFDEWLRQWMKENGWDFLLFPISTVALATSILTGPT